jgi:hypothetical protein
MPQPEQNRLNQLLDQLRLDESLPQQLPGQEGEMLRAALDGEDIYAIAQRFQVSERAVWDALGRSARFIRGEASAQVETGGLGSDTDPGVTGGYGDTGFGSLGNEPPEPISEEPGAGPANADLPSDEELASSVERLRREADDKRGTEES